MERSLQTVGSALREAAGRAGGIASSAIEQELATTAGRSAREAFRLTQRPAAP